ncbi:hypothetical protein KY336_03915 [Candidatus Woesearchaeota archaeon]|nr:hypothetical protein [Candidatus Woesearchaeota archaeon]
MQKRGQVTTYIIIGLIIVVIVSLILFLNYRSSEKYAETQQKGVQHFSINALKIEPYVKECIHQQAVVALVESMEKTGDTILPPIEEIEDTIEDYINRRVDDCVDFSQFKEFEVEAGRINASVNVYKEHFVASIDWPILIKQNDLTITKSDFRAEFPFKLNELYIKVQEIVEKNKDNNLSLDLDFILGQGLNIEIIGCKGNNIKYLVNDKEFMLDNNIFQFFFNTPIRDLIEIFEFDNGIKFKLPFKAGKQVMRKNGESKRLMFDTTETGFIEGCFKKDDKTDYYTFSLVENNKVPAAVSRKEAMRVLIERIDTVDIAEFEADFIADSMFELTAPYGFEKGILYLYSEDDSNIYHFTGEEWVKLNTTMKDNYAIAEIEEVGLYASRRITCSAVNIVEEPELTIVIVPSEYENLSLFSSHASKHASDLLDLTGINANVYKIMEPTTIRCDAWNMTECLPANVKSNLAACVDEGVDAEYTIVLIGKGLIGLDHQTVVDVSYIGSYLTDDTDYCNTCYTLYEFGRFIGLGETIANMTDVNMTRMIPVMSVNNFEPTEISYEQMYFTEDEKETIKQKLEQK